MRGGVILGAATLAATLAGGCSSSGGAPSAAWCSEIEPFLRLDGSPQGTIDVTEITDENQEQVERESSELRSRLAVLVSSSPSSIRGAVDDMLSGHSDVTLEEMATARADVTEYYLDRC